MVFLFLFSKDIFIYILIQTAEPRISNLLVKLNLLNMNNSIFVFHHIDFSYSLPFTNLLNNYQKWSLGNFSLGIQVNPHYFGEMKLKSKNNITRFFITSTINRKYDFLISAAQLLKEESQKFHIIVVGKTLTFNKAQIPRKLKNKFTFKYNIQYHELYKEVYESDFIIINLEPDNTEDVNFHKIRVTGSAQLAYGFLKPVLINEYFSNFYGFNYSNALIYKKSNFSAVMKNAINLNHIDYTKMRENLSFLSNKIYNVSLYNIKTSLQIK